MVPLKINYMRYVYAWHSVAVALFDVVRGGPD